MSVAGAGGNVAAPSFVTIGAATAALNALTWTSASALRALLFVAMATVLIVALRRSLLSLWEPPDHAALAVGTAVATFAFIVACGFVLGALRQIALGWYVAAHAMLFAGALRLAPRAAPEPANEWGRLPSWVVGLLGALVTLAVAFAIVQSPFTLYDSLSYHLFFPARWLQERALTIVPTPFSDPAQAYAPGNGELFLLWLMVPFHSDALARAGQLPFALLAAVTLYALARRLGAPPQHAIYPAGFLLLSRPLLEQAIGANVDLICAAMFLASLLLGVVAVERDRARDWLLCGVGLGLYFGTKYLALIYLPALLLVAAAGRPRWKMAWALPGMLAFAAPWYLRNWIVAGSPLYPAALTVAGATIAPGAFDRLAMFNTVFHVTEVRLFGIIAARALGPTLAPVWLPAAIVGGVALIRRGWWPHTVLALLPYLMIPLFWFGLPVNIDSRFLMPAVLPALLPFAFAFRRGRVWNGAVHAVYFASMIWILVGASVEVAARGPWFMRGWLTFNGLLTRPATVWCAALAIGLTLLWRVGPRRTPWAAAFAAAIVAIPAAALAWSADRWCAPGACTYLDTTPPYLRANLIAGWRWVADHVHGATIAYTGINLPYPLAGSGLTNHVVYVNIDGRSRWRFDDYDRAFRSGRFTPAPPLLASPSGELLPLSDRFGATRGAIRPRFERMTGDRGAWVASLRRLGVDYLFVSSLSAYEIDNVWHNGRGFPIEDEWASAGGPFRLEYENPQVRVFAVDRHEDRQ